MSRDAGFPTADVDTSLLDDPKFRTLWRRQGSKAARCQAVTVYLATVLESWRAGERETAESAAPMWLGDVTASTAALSDVGLLDEAGRIPEHAWQSWFVPAFDRREARRAAGALGGQHKASNARATLQQTSSDALPVPSLTVPTEVNGIDTGIRAGAWDEYGPEWAAFRAASEARGFRKPPTEKQRAALWPIVEARPVDVGRWVTEAPEGAKYSAIVGHVFAEWASVRTSLADEPPAAHHAEAKRQLPNAVSICAGCGATLSGGGIEQDGKRFHETCAQQQLARRDQ